MGLSVWENRSRHASKCNDRTIYLIDMDFIIPILQILMAFIYKFDINYQENNKDDEKYQQRIHNLPPVIKTVYDDHNMYLGIARETRDPTCPQCQILVAVKSLSI